MNQFQESYCVEQKLHNFSQDFRVLETSNQQFKSFISKLEWNHKCEHSDPDTFIACLACWSLLQNKNRSKHLEHESYFISSEFFKDKESFLQLAQDCDKVSDDKRVIVFKDNCQIGSGRPLGLENANEKINAQTNSWYRQTLNYQQDDDDLDKYDVSKKVKSILKGKQPDQLLSEVCTGQIEIEYSLKRINQVCDTLQDKTGKDKERLQRLEEQIRDLL